MTEMRAALFDRYGPPDVLYEGTVPRPVTGRDRVLVRVLAATVNGGELILRSGALPSWFMRGPFPRQTGLDFVGEVVEVGDAVTTYSVGDRVWGLLEEKPDESGQTLRSLAEYVAVPPDCLAPAPRTLDPAQAATLPVGSLTALIGLRHKAGLRDGERLLVRGAAGGVGSAVVQVGVALGAKVTALAGATTLNFVTGLGAAEAHDYRTTSPDDLGRFDVVFDTVGTELPRYRRLLAPGGRMIAARFDTDHLVRSLATIAASAVHGRSRIRFFRGAPDAALLNEISEMADTGVLRPLVDESFPLSRVADAHRRLEQGGVRGKIVVTLA